MDDQGMARTSDVIAAAQWILRNKDQYDIRVANLSPIRRLRAASDKAVEKLWFGGVVVVAHRATAPRTGTSPTSSSGPRTTRS